MQSIFLTKRTMHERYDLKGSWVDRHVRRKKGEKPHGDLKDSDLNMTLLLPEEKRELFLKQVSIDTTFLESCNIMDYSLLLGIHKVRHVVETDISETTDESGVERYTEFIHTVHTHTGSATATPQNIIGASEPHEPEGGFSKSDSMESFTNVGGGTPKLHSPEGVITPTSIDGKYEGDTPTPNESASTQYRIPQSSLDNPTSLNYRGNERDEKKRIPHARSYQHEPPFFQAEEGGIKATIVEGPGAYYMGIIDILQEYDTHKKFERFAKVYLRCKDPLGISCVEPEYYRERFVSAMNTLTEANGPNDPHRPQLARKNVSQRKKSQSKATSQLRSEYAEGTRRKILSETLTDITPLSDVIFDPKQGKFIKPFEHKQFERKHSQNHQEKKDI